jgi:hypothetical protein
MKLELWIIIAIIVVAIILLILFFVIYTCSHSKKKKEEVSAVTGMTTTPNIVHNTRINEFTENENKLIEEGKNRELVDNYRNTLINVRGAVDNARDDVIMEGDINNIVFLLGRNPIHNTIMENLVGGFERGIGGAFDEDQLFDMANIDFEYNFEVFDNIFQQQVDPLFRDTIDVLGNRTTSWRVNTAKEASDNKKEAVENYFDLSKKVKSDTQNVHDSNVNKHLKETYTQLKKDDFLITKKGGFDEILRFIGNSKLDDVKRDNARKALYHIRDSPLKVFSLGNDVYLRDILLLVWNRAYHPDNDENAKDIRESVVESLADCVENKQIVCSGGVAARLLSSLGLLDHDENVGITQSTEMYRNEIFGEAKKIFDDELKNAEKLGDENTKLFARSFADLSVKDEEITKETREKFYQNVEKKVDDTLNGYDPKYIPIGMKKEIMAGFDII